MPDKMTGYYAIVTKFVGPTNHRGSRVIARCIDTRITHSWDHRLNPDGNHMAAARKLADKLGWPEPLLGGALPDDSGYCFVRVMED